ncbi:MAG: hypothetical protein WA705_23090 [Candidatus Ozemobacteraceae bacterium]
MLKTSLRNVAVAVLGLSVLLGTVEVRKAEAKGKHHKKIGFFTRVGRTIKRKVKRVCKKVHRGVVKAGAAVTNKVMDSAVHAKSAVTGKKPKYVWVKGHYKKGNKHHTTGHWARVSRKHKPSGGGAPAPAPAPSPEPAPAPSAGPLPPLADPAMPQ